MKRAAIYCRVSTEDQADSGYSLNGQKAECRAYAERIGASVVAELHEDASGAKPVTDRLQGARLFELVRRREVDAVIVHRVDRLSRDIVDLLVTVRSWLKAGIEIHAGDVGKIESDNDITLIIKGWQGTDERKKIRERSMLGKRTKALSGRVVGTRPPYGYHHVRDEKGKVVNLEPFREEAQIVRLIFQWYVYGDEEGRCLPARSIGRRLSDMGVITPGERGKGYHLSRSPGVWHPDTIRKMLAHEVYAGVWHFGRMIGCSHQLRPEEEWIPVEVPAIVDRGTWQKAQERARRNKEFARRNAKRDYLLSGIIRCACHTAMAGDFCSNHRYYSCATHKIHFKGLEPRICHQKSIRADAIEADVWESIVRLFSDLPRLERLLFVAQQEEIAAMDPKRDELQAVEGMMGEAENEAADIAQALKRASGKVGQILEQNMEDVNRRYEALCKRRDELMDAIGQAKLTDQAIQDALLFAEDVRAGIEDPGFETMRRNLETFQIGVTIQGRRFVVASKIGTWDGEIRRLPKAGGKVGTVTDLYSQTSYNYYLSPGFIALMQGAAFSAGQAGYRMAEMA